MGKNTLAPLPAQTKILKRHFTYSRLIATLTLLLITTLALGARLLGFSGHASDSLLPNFPFSPAQPKLAAQKNNSVYQCPAFTAVGDDAGDTLTWHGTTPDYTLTLNIGPAQSIWTEQQAREMTQHDCLLWGEVTRNASVVGDAIPQANDVEVRLTIQNRLTGQVLTDLEKLVSLAIYYHGNANIQQVTLMGLYDPVNESTPFHYGANVTSSQPDIDKIVVSINGQNITFKISK